MEENKKYKARYFNGKSAIPELGQALITNNSISFISAGKPHRFGIDHFFGFDHSVNGCKFTLFSDEHQESPLLEIYCTKEEAGLFKKHWIHHKVGTNFYEKCKQALERLSPAKTIIAGLTFLAFFVFLYFIALQKLYILFPTSIDEKLASRFDQEIEKSLPICQNENIDRFFQLALKELVPKNSQFTYLVKVIEMPEANAFALAGGRLYFFSGLLQSAESQDEVLGVLAHEIAHIEKRHHLRSLVKAMGTSIIISLLVGPGLGDFQALETMTELGSTIAVLKFTRDFETEADIYSMEIMKNANHSLRGLLQFLTRMNSEEKKQLSSSDDSKNENNKKENSNTKINQLIALLSTHPPTEERIQSLKKLIKSDHRSYNKQIVSRGDWQKIRTSCSGAKGKLIE